MKITSAEVVDMIGFKDGEFTQELIGPNIEPWFVVNVNNEHISGVGLFYTKDAKSYISWWDHYCLDKHEWEHDEQIIVKVAIEHYVTELAEHA